MVTGFGVLANFFYLLSTALECLHYVTTKRALALRCTAIGFLAAETLSVQQGGTSLQRLLPMHVEKIFSLCGMLSSID